MDNWNLFILSTLFVQVNNNFLSVGNANKEIMVIPTDFTGYSISNAFITVIFINLILPPATDVLRM